MRIAIINLTGGGISGGYRKYLIQMLPRLGEDSEIERILCISPAGIRPESWFKAGPSIDFSSFGSTPFKQLFFQPDYRVRASLDEFCPDVIFLPIGHFIKYREIPVVNMIQNMEPFIQNIPEDTRRNRIIRLLQRHLTRESVRRSQGTIAISRFVKEYLVTRLGTPDSKICQIYFGSDGLDTPVPRRPSQVPMDWAGRFLFTAGSIRPARGLEDLISSLNDLRLDKLELKLVIAGEISKDMRKYHERLRRLIQKKGVSGRVLWTGRISDSEMNWCFANCRIFIMTSRIEACPNIALEALKNRCCCISTDAPPMPEIFGDAAVFYSAGDSASLSSRIMELIALDSAERNRLIQSAADRASLFSWETCAKKTVMAYKSVLDQGTLSQSEE